jgi:hypothetical protein
MRKTKIDKALESTDAEPDSISSMPLNTLEDYKRYNEAASKANKRLRIARYPIKPAPIELHPHKKVEFFRNDQPMNPLPVYLSNSEIEFKKELKPTKVYKLPLCIIDYLQKKGRNQWKRFTNPDGTVENRIVGFEPRFSFREVYDKESA